MENKANKWKKVLLIIVGVWLSSMIVFLLFSFAAVMVLSFIFGGDVIGPIDGAFSGQEHSLEKINTSKENIDLTYLSEEPDKYAIESFDVNEDGTVAVAYRNFLTVYVSVYSDNGDFLYGYSFTSWGSYLIEWTKEGNIGVFLVRSDSFLELDGKGNVISWISVDDTEENRKHSSDLGKMNETNVNGANYRLENKKGPYNLISSTYTRLVITDADGNETVFYDVNTKQLIMNIALTVFIVVFFTVAFIGANKEAKKIKLSNNRL